MPYRPYYGTADATRLWLILLTEYWRWTLDDDFVRGLRDMLGLNAVDGQLVMDPRVPAEIGRLRVSRILALGQRWDIEAQDATGSIRPSSD